MRGDFNNSEGHLSRLGPNCWSVDQTAERISQGLQTWTGKRWDVSLKKDGPVPGGFLVEPAEKYKGRFHPSDWQDLVDLFGVVPLQKASRYYILPDEVLHVLEVLKQSGPLSVRKTKVGQAEQAMVEKIEVNA